MPYGIGYPAGSSTVLSQAVPVPEKDRLGRTQAIFSGLTGIIESTAAALERLRVKPSALPQYGDTKPPFLYYDPKTGFTGGFGGLSTPLLLIGVGVVVFAVIAMRK